MGNFDKSANISCKLESNVVRNVIPKVELGSCVVDGGSGRAKGQDGGGGTFAGSKSLKRGVDWRIFADVRSALNLRIR